MKKHQTKKAFTIIETLITLLAVTIMIAGPLTFMYKSYTYSQFIKAKVIATGLSQEGLELATSLRDEDINDFQSVANVCAKVSTTIVGCYVDWDGQSSKPTFSSSPCDITNDSCRLYDNSAQTPSGSMYGKQNSGSDPATDFYRYVTFTPNVNSGRTEGYTVESVSWTTVGNIKVSVNLKKIIFNLTIK